MAKEWACKHNTLGIVNKYLFNEKGLKIVNLLDSNYTVLNWIALLLKNRVFSVQDEMVRVAHNDIIQHFSLDTSSYDLIVGYSAVGSYFSYAQSFAASMLPLRSLSKTLFVGGLGEQIVFVSNKAFKQIEFAGLELVDPKIYHS